MNKQMQQHWDQVFSVNAVDQLGWYETAPTPSLQLVSRCDINHTDAILDVGCGASTLIEHLLAAGFIDITAMDISSSALQKLKEGLRKEKAARIKWMVDDITRPTTLHKLREVALWHDRAVLHFLVEEADRQSYLATLKKVIKKDGYVIIAAFSLAGARKCSGLPVRNYDHQLLADFLGDGFQLLEYFHHTHQMPSGDPRPFIYTLFRRSLPAG